MENKKDIFAKNLINLRKKHKMTQLELAEKLNYTDKAISKWERGESLPDMVVMVEIAALFQLSLDDLILNEIDIENSLLNVNIAPRFNYKMALIISSSIVILALAIFVLGQTFVANDHLLWHVFIYAALAIFICLTVFSKKAKQKSLVFIFSGALSGTAALILYLYLSFISYSWMIFLIPFLVLVMIYVSSKR